MGCPDFRHSLRFLQIKMKIQSDKQSLIPDAFMLDWDNLSETELKRLVVQLEKTRGDVMLDLRDAQVPITMLVHSKTYTLIYNI